MTRLSGLANKGFSLPGLAVMVVIVGIMAGTMNTMWSTAAKRDRESELEHRLLSINRALNRYAEMTGSSPENLEFLVQKRVGGVYLLRPYCLVDPVTGEDFQNYVPDSHLRSAASGKSQSGVDYSKWKWLKCTMVGENENKKPSWKMIEEWPQDEDEFFNESEY